MYEPDLKENPRRDLEILVVDGDPITQLIHCSRLQKNFGLPIFNCGDGAEALHLIRENPERDYLVLLDINMKGMNGWEFLEELETAQLKSQVYVIMVTCSVSSCDKRMAKSFPQVLDYFEKPLSNAHVQKIPHLPKLIPYFVSAN